MKVLVGAFNQEKALVGPFSVIVKTYCETDGALVSTSYRPALTLPRQIVKEYERAVVFRLGRLRSGGAKGPGLMLVMPCIDSYRCIDLRCRAVITGDWYLI